MKTLIKVRSRGTCSFVAKASAAAAAGAVAIGVVNNAAGLFNPAIPGVTIPFIELEKSDSAKFLSATAPVSASIAPAQLPNAGFKLAAGFSSGGPRTGDGALKPDVAAPGVNVFSTNIGTGTGGTYDSGTSMATPHVAGVAALAIQAPVPGTSMHSRPLSRTRCSYPLRPIRGWTYPSPSIGSSLRTTRRSALWSLRKTTDRVGQRRHCCRWTTDERHRAGVKGLTSARYLFQNGNPAPGAPFAERRRRLTTLGWPLILARDIPDYEFAVPSVIEKICPNRSAAATFLVVPHSSLPAA